jgi:phosphoglycolate phosphatase-like HAD superfamily hydrolase
LSTENQTLTADFAAVQRGFFTGIDSDGSAIDNMERKHKECFVPNTIASWGLEAVAAAAREAIEFTNLYSRTRGANRWKALLLALKLLRSHPEVLRRGFEVPELPAVQAFVGSGETLSNEGLERYMAAHPSTELTRALDWSRRVNAASQEKLAGLPPFPGVRESLTRLRQHARSAIISQTPHAELVREWRRHGMETLVDAIGGPEFGQKSQQFTRFAGAAAEPGRWLMIGDAAGDWEAAEAVGALFYPINPGGEAKSWRRFQDEGLPRFLQGTFAGGYQAALLEEFLRRIPPQPPWLG